MPKLPTKSIWLELQIDPNDPELLTTLDILVRSRILNRAQILELARTCLSEDIPWKSPPVREAAPIPAIIPIPASPKLPSPIQTIWQTLKDELSVRWLLFLGVFLVVLSSGVLAATQWSLFPAWGQYGLLWLYTIGFWAVGGWARRQEGLRLTASTLQLVAMLLIPVNFWAIDSFGLWHQPLELVTAIVAGVSLVGMAYAYGRLGRADTSRSKPRLHDNTRQNYARLLLGGYVGLSFLQLGWQIPYWAAIAIYIGAIGTAIVLQKVRQIEGGILAIYGLGILLLRGLFVAHLPLYTFGLAIGIVGWLFAQWSLQKDARLERLNWLDRDSRKQTLPLRLVRYQTTLRELARLYRGLGASLLILGWVVGIGDLVSAPKTSSWQAFAVSCLGIVWIWQRLRQNPQNREVVLLFFVGLQTYFVSSFLWSPLATGAIFAKVLPVLLDLFGSNYFIAGSLFILPYLLIWVWLTGWFYRQGKISAYRRGESLILLTGALLPIVNITTPLSLLIDLFASVAILAHLTLRYQPVRTLYIYLTHLCALGTIFAALFYRWEWCRSWLKNFIGVFGDDNFLFLDLTLNLTILAVTFTAIAVGELCLSAQPVKRESDPWQKSSWYIGLGLAILTYGCLITLKVVSSTGAIPSICWLFVPIAFTYIATRKPPVQPWQLKSQLQAGWYAIGSLGAGLWLSVNLSQWRSIVLIVAVGLMFPLVKRLKQISAAGIQIGFGLGLGVNLLLGNISPNYWLVVGALTCGGLWFISKKLPEIYAIASDRWAIAIAGLGLSIGTLIYAYNDLNWYIDSEGLSTFQTPFAAGSTMFEGIYFTTLLATGILIGAMVFRQRWEKAPLLEWKWFWCLNLAMQISLSALVHLVGGNTLNLATVNIILAFPLWGWMRRQGMPESKIFPCLLAGWGLILRGPFFTGYTGLLTIGVGVVGVLTSHQSRAKSIGYGGLLLVTLGCYELVTYPLLQAPPGGNIADALTIYGFITAVLALGYRLGVWWYARKGATTWGNFPLPGLKNLAHLHWAGASTWKVAAATMPAIPIPQLTLLHLSISALLGGYALIQARDRASGDWWIYLGLAELLGVGVYARSIFQNLGVVDEGIILVACTIGLLLLLAPWREWGWDERPWRIVGFILPLSRVIFEFDRISLLNLAVLAIFYAGVARRQRQFGWAYLSLIFVNWVGIKLLFQYGLTSPLWYAILFGCSVLVAVQWDPRWQSARQDRHYGRILGSGTIAVTALIWHQPWLPIGIGIAIAIMGLALKVRSWFYVGTITFILTNVYQLVLLITDYPITKWAIGLLAGILIITLAANFERRKEQIERALKHWLDRLQEWE